VSHRARPSSLRPCLQIQSHSEAYDLAYDLTGPSLATAGRLNSQQFSRLRTAFCQTEKGRLHSNRESFFACFAFFLIIRSRSKCNRGKMELRERSPASTTRGDLSHHSPSPHLGHTPTRSVWDCTTPDLAHLCTFIYYLFWWDRGLNSGLHACKAGVLLLEPHLQLFCSGFFGDGVM
jgi:hypothetical protein